MYRYLFSPGKRGTGVFFYFLHKYLYIYGIQYNRRGDETAHGVTRAVVLILIIVLILLVVLLLLIVLIVLVLLVLLVLIL